MILSLKYLIFSLFLVVHFTYSQDISQNPFGKYSPSDTEEIIPIINKGFIKYKIAHLPDKTVLNVTFYNLNADQISAKKIELPFSKYMGFAANGTENNFIFFSKSNKELYIPKFDCNGKLLTSLLLKTKETIRSAVVVYSDSTGYYTFGKDRSSVTFTKHNFQNDTLWQKNIPDNGKTINVNAVGKSKHFYIGLNIQHENSVLLSFDDNTGALTYQKEVGESVRARTIQKLIVEENEEIVIAGEEFSGKKSEGFAEGIFLMRVDSIGKNMLNSFYSWNKINHSNQFDTTYLGSRLSNIFIRDIIKAKNHHKILAETALRADKIRGEGLALQIASLVVLTPIIGFAPIGNMEVSKIASYDLLLLTPNKNNDSLILQKVTKEPIVRKYNFNVGAINQEHHLFFDRLDIFDYKFKYQYDNGSEDIFYYYALSTKDFTLAKASIDTEKPIEVKKFKIMADGLKPSFYKFYPLSKESVLVEMNTENSSGFNVIQLKDFN